MTPLCITSSTDMTSGHEVAQKFDLAFRGLMDFVKAYERAQPVPGSISKVYIMVIFESEPNKTSRPRYKRSSNSVEAYTRVTPAEFTNLEHGEQLQLLIAKLLEKLQEIGCMLDRKNVTHEIAELVCSLRNNYSATNGQAFQGTGQATTNLRRSLPVIASEQDEINENYQIVVQFPTAVFPNSDEMFEIEERLAESLGELGDVDGNDVGEGRYNIFVLTPEPYGTSERILDFLRKADLMQFGSQFS